MPIGTGIIYNVGDLILSQVSGSGTSFLETKIAAATSSIVYFDSTARINSASLNSITVGTASYVSGSTSIITNLTASNISASGTGSFGMVGIGTTSPTARLHVSGSTDGVFEVDTLGGATSFYVSASGNVGIGTPIPTARLDVRPNTPIAAYQGTVPYQTTTAAILSPVMAAASTDTYTSILQLVSVRQALVAGRYAHGYLGFSTVDNSNVNGILDAGRISIKNDEGIGTFSATAMGFWTNPGGSASTAAIERVRIASDGNVGIGTTSATTKLHVSGSVTALDGRFISNVTSGTDKYFLDCYGTSTNQIFALYENSNTAYLNSYSSMAFRANQNGGSGGYFVFSGANVGIGTTSPTNGTLQVYNASGNTLSLQKAAGGAALAMGSDTTNYALIESINAGGIRFYTGNGTQTERLRIDVSGSVGIGTTSPAYKLDVIGPATSNGVTLRLSDAASLANSRHILLTRGSVSGSIGIAGSQIEDPLWLSRSSGYDLIVASSGNVGVGTSIPGALLEVSSSTAASLLNVKGAGGNGILFVSGSGNVGIGTTTPGAKLDVVGDLRVKSAGAAITLDTSATSDGRMEYKYNGTRKALIGVDSDNLQISADSGNYLQFRTNGSQRMIINNAGGVGIGTSNPNYAFDVYTNGSADALMSIRASGSANARIYFDAANGDLTGGDYCHLGQDKSTLNFVINTGGSAGNIHLQPKEGTNNGILFVSGSTRFGLVSTQNHQFTGSVSVSGSLNATASWATNALTASSLVAANSYTITNLTASNISASLTGSFGMVGIGTTSPVGKLTVQGNIEVNYNSITADSSVRRSFLTAHATINRGANIAFGLLDGGSVPGGMTVYNTAAAAGAYNSQFIGFNTHEGGVNEGERMRITSLGNVGIGTTSPGALLEISSSTAASLLNVKGAGGNGLLFVSGSGLVGIGTPIPTARLDVRPTTAIAYQGTVPYQTTTAAILSPVMAAASTDTYTSILQLVSVRQALVAGRYAHGYLGFSTVDNSNISGLLDAGRISIKNDEGVVLYSGTSLGFWTNTGGSASNPATERVRITSDGNVGIGQTSPASKLHVVGSSFITGSANTSNVKFEGGGGNGLAFGTIDATSTYASWIQSGYVSNFGTATYNLLLQPLGGNVGINTTSPSTPLAVQSNAKQLRLQTTSGPTSYFTDIGARYDSSHPFTIEVANGAATATEYFGIYADGGGANNRIALLNGNVGIGTTAPAAKLEITGSSNSVLLNIKSAISGAILYVSGSGAVGIGTSNVGAYTLQVSGSFAATTKSFVIEHPTKAGKKLIYGSLESPYHGIRLTGRDTLVNGKCKIQLPDYIYKLILHDSVNIQLTGIKCNKTLYVDEINIPENYFTIAYDKAIFESYKDYDFFWDFTGIRADVPELITEL